MPRYAELEVTTNFTFLRGGSHPEELVATAKALGLDAIAVTDVNTLAGVVRGHLAAKEAGIKFIVGVRLDLQDAPSLLAFPHDRAAYGRLCRLLTLGQRRTEKGACTLYLDDVAAHAEGLSFIVLPPDDFPLRQIADSIPPLDGEGGAPFSAPGGVSVPASAFDPPPRRHKAASDLPTRGRYFETQLRRIKATLPARVSLAARYAYRGDDRARIASLAELATR